MLGEVAVGFDCLGASSLSNILDILASLCTRPSPAERSITWVDSDVHFEIQVGVSTLGISMTSSWPHSSAAVHFVGDCGGSPSTTGISSFSSSGAGTAASDVLGWLDLDSEEVPFDSGGTDLDKSEIQSIGETMSAPLLQDSVLL